MICDPLWASHMLASQLDDIPPRGPRVYLYVIWMDKSHSWSMCLNPYFPNTQCHLYSHPVTVWCLMSSKHPSGDGGYHDLMVEGIRLLCIRKLIANELLKWLDLYATLSIGVCPSYHPPNDMIMLLITSQCSWSRNHDHLLTNKLVLQRGFTWDSNLVYESHKY